MKLLTVEEKAVELGVCVGSVHRYALHYQIPWEQYDKKIRLFTAGVPVGTIGQYASKEVRKRVLALRTWTATEVALAAFFLHGKDDGRDHFYGLRRDKTITPISLDRPMRWHNRDVRRYLDSINTEPLPFDPGTSKPAEPLATLPKTLTSRKKKKSRLLTVSIDSEILFSQEV